MRWRINNHLTILLVLKSDFPPVQRITIKINKNLWEFLHALIFLIPNSCVCWFIHTKGREWCHFYRNYKDVCSIEYHKIIYKPLFLCNDKKPCCLFDKFTLIWIFFFCLPFLNHKGIWLLVISHNSLELAGIYINCFLKKWAHALVFEFKNFP